MTTEKEEDNLLIHFNQFLEANLFQGQPENLYESMNYIMQLGGKRIRPLLILFFRKSLGKQIDEDFMKLALAIEIFHNFSLVHDDIMDGAEIRRGYPTVHKKWNEPTAILSGDNLLIKAYETLLNTDFENKNLLLKEFTEMAFRICEGQQMDMNMAKTNEVDEETYMKMIRFKTAELPAYCLKLSAIASHCNNNLSSKIYEFGIHFGLAFQLQDDWLDTFGNEKNIGKKKGGDILENKKTLLFIHAFNQLNGNDKNILTAFYNNRVLNENDKIEKVTDLFIQAQSDLYLSNKINFHFEKANEILNYIKSEFQTLDYFEDLMRLIQKREN